MARFAGTLIVLSRASPESSSSILLMCCAWRLPFCELRSPCVCPLDMTMGSSSREMPSSLHFDTTLSVSRISEQLGRSLGSTLSMSCSTFTSYCEYWRSIGGYYPLRTRLYRPFMSLALKGGLSEHISYKTQPNDQMSLLEP